MFIPVSGVLTLYNRVNSIINLKLVFLFKSLFKFIYAQIIEKLKYKKVLSKYEKMLLQTDLLILTYCYCIFKKRHRLNLKWDNRKVAIKSLYGYFK